MKKILGLVIFSLLISFNVNSHSGGTNAGGCHMNYTTGQYHCHQAKQPDPFKTYYYIKHQGRSYGPYSSYSSCMAAIRGSGVMGAICSTSKY